MKIIRQSLRLLVFISLIIAGTNSTTAGTGVAFFGPNSIEASDGKFDGQIQVSWQAVNGASAYAVYRSTLQYNTRETLELLAHVPSMGTINVLNDSRVEPGKVYYYWVSPRIDSIGWGDLYYRDSGYAVGGPVINFPDSNLAQIIQTELGITDRPITETDMLQLTSLSNSQAGQIIPISNLSGLEFARNLVLLNISQSSELDLSPLADLNALQTLYLYNNQIADISPLTNLTALQTLYLRNNQIADISPLTNLTALRTLYLDNNQIADISPLTNLMALRSIDLRYNLLYLVENSPAMKVIDSTLTIPGIQVRYLPQKDLSTIDTDTDGLFDLTEWQIITFNGDDSIVTFADVLPGDDFDLDGVSNLDEQSDGTDPTDPASLKFVVQIPDPALKAAIANRLSLDPEGDMYSTDMQDLTTLSIYNDGPISDLTGLESALNLYSLTLNAQEIADLSPLAELTNLRFLDLVNNQISDLSPLAGLTSLNRLDLTGNRITDIAPLTQLQLQYYRTTPVLRISRNFIDFTGDAEQAGYLETLQAIEGLTVEFEPQYPQDKPTLVDFANGYRAQEGRSLTLWVNAKSLTELSYAWKFNGIVIEGATGSSLELINLTQADSGLYSVLISDINGEILQDFEVDVLSPASLQVNIRNGIGLWKLESPFESGWIDPGQALIGLFETDLVQVSFAPIQGYWTPVFSIPLVAGSNQAEVAYIAEPEINMAAGEVDLISFGFDERTEIRGGSVDGSVIVGNYSGSTPWTPMIWEKGTGLYRTPRLPDSLERTSFVTTQDASADGSILVGRDYDQSGNILPVVYNKSAGSYLPEVLPFPDPSILESANYTTLGRAVAINDVGTVIVGQLLDEGAVWVWNGSSWDDPILTGMGPWETNENYLYKDLWLYDISEDGKVAAGFINLVDTTYQWLEQAIVWKDDTISALPSPPEATTSTADSVSGDGLAVVGNFYGDMDPSLALWKWNAASGTWDYADYPVPEGMISIDVQSFINRTSYVASLALFSEAANAWIPYIWSESFGFVEASTWLEDNFAISFGDDWMANVRYANSRTGVAYGELTTLYGDIQGYRARIPENASFAEMTIAVNHPGGHPARWRVGGGNWHESGETATVLAGQQWVEFENALGFETIESYILDIPENESISQSAETVPVNQIGTLNPGTRNILPNFKDTYYRTVPDGAGRIWVSGGISTMSGFGDSLSGALALLDENTGHPIDGFSLALDHSIIMLLDAFQDGSALVAALKGSTKKRTIYKILPSGEVDPQFMPYTVQGSVRMGKILEDGKIIFGYGYSDDVTDEAYIIRLLPNGIEDPSWEISVLENREQGYGFQTNIWADFVVDDFGRLLAGGSFTHVNDTAMPGIVRLLGDGTVDGTFNPQTRQYNIYPVRMIGLQSDGRILLGTRTLDKFGELETQAPYGFPLVRLLPNGAFDWGFNLEDFNAITRTSRDLLVLDDDSFVCAMDDGVAKFLPDGTLDQSFPILTSIIDEIQGITDYPDTHYSISKSGGYLYIVGSMAETGSNVTVNGHHHYGLYRTDISGEVDTAFNPGQPFGLAFPDSATPISADAFLLNSSVFPNSFSHINSSDLEYFAEINLSSGTYSLPSVNEQVSNSGDTVKWLDTASDETGWFGLYEDSEANMVKVGFFEGNTYNGDILMEEMSPDYSSYGIELFETGAIVLTRTADNFRNLVFPDNLSFTRFEYWSDEPVQIVDTLVQDPTFGNEYVLGDGPVNLWDLSMQDGKALVSMPDASGFPVLARYLDDGSIDPTFTPILFRNEDRIETTRTYYPSLSTVSHNESSASINAVETLPDGRLLIGGNFSEALAYPQYLDGPSSIYDVQMEVLHEGSPLLIIEPDGSVSSSNNLPDIFLTSATAELEASVHEIMPMAQYLYILGNFDRVNDTVCGGIVRIIKSTLQLDPRFNPSLQYQDYLWDEPRSSIQRLPNDDLLVMGQFVQDGDTFPTPLSLLDMPPVWTVQTHAIINSGGDVTQGGEYEDGSMISLEAIANEGYTFNGWSGTVTSGSTSLNLKVTYDLLLVANFAEIPTEFGELGSDSVVYVPGKDSLIDPDTSGYDLEYQWFMGHPGDESQPLSEASSSDVLDLATLDLLTGESYTLWLRAVNGIGSVTHSSPVRLDVFEPLEMTAGDYAIDPILGITIADQNGWAWSERIDWFLYTEYPYIYQANWGWLRLTNSTTESGGFIIWSYVSGWIILDPIYPGSIYIVTEDRWDNLITPVSPPSLQ